MRFVWIVALAVVLFGQLPQTVFAHSGGGPPFLTINGKYAQTNPYFLGGPQVPVSQDLPPESYIVNQPIDLVIDTSKLLVPKDIIDKSTFRWSFYDQSHDYQYGTKLTYTYPKTGSFMLNLEVKGPQDQEFFLLDTIMMNILPNANYHMPTAKIATQESTFIPGQAIHFSAQTTTDTSTKIRTYNWYFGTQTPAHTQVTSYTYSEKDFVEYVFLQVVDDNGIAAIDAIQSVGTDGKIALSGLTPGAMTVPVVRPDLPAKKLPLMRYFLPSLLGIVSIGLLTITIKKSIKRRA